MPRVVCEGCGHDERMKSANTEDVCRFRRMDEIVLRVALPYTSIAGRRTSEVGDDLPYPFPLTVAHIDVKID